jgi:hypothetical protein
VLLFTAEKISVFSNHVTTNPGSALSDNNIDNNSSGDSGSCLFFGERDSEPIQQCEIVVTTLIPNPLSGETKIKCLNGFNLQVIIYKSTNHSLLSKSNTRSSGINNSSQILNVLQI